jgi:transcriptional/translational regulatory protein YebC/TACO1
LEIPEREESAGKPNNREEQLPNGKIMTRDDIIRIAIEAGARDCANPDKWDIWEIRDKDLERFAALVAAHEREACAKVADRQNGDDEQDPESCVWSKAARHIAIAIRARGDK